MLQTKGPRFSASSRVSGPKGRQILLTVRVSRFSSEEGLFETVRSCESSHNSHHSQSMAEGQETREIVNKWQLYNMIFH